jgi:hypothetical protein
MISDGRFFKEEKKQHNGCNQGEEYQAGTDRSFCSSAAWLQISFAK